MTRVPPPGTDQREHCQGGDARVDRSTRDPQYRVSGLGRLRPAALGEVNMGLEGKQVEPKQLYKPLSPQYLRPGARYRSARS